MKKKDQENKWLIPTRSNSTESHVVRRVSRFSGQPLVPEEPVQPQMPQTQMQPNMDSTQSHAVQRVNRHSALQKPVAPEEAFPPQMQPNVNSAQSHAVTRRRGAAPVINPAPDVQRGGYSGYPQPDDMPPGAASAVSYAPPRLSRPQQPQQPPEILPTSAVSEVSRRTKDPDLGMMGQNGSQPVNRVRQEDIHPVQMHQMPQPSTPAARVRPLPTDNTSETRFQPVKPVMEVAEMPRVNDSEENDSANQFANRWNLSKDPDNN